MKTKDHKTVLAMLAFITVFAACKKDNSVNSAVINHHVGKLYGGGVIYYLWQDSAAAKHGLIASLADISAASAWSSVTLSAVGTAARSPVDGAANTAAIIAQGDTSGAAFICDKYIAGSFTDWYLPAAWELHNLYLSAFVVNNIAGVTPLIFNNGNYWSSTENTNTNVWYQNFSFGAQNFNVTKSARFAVRAVRRF